MADYIGAIDQGTTSTRFIVFDRDGSIVTADQREHEQINPRAGWVEHDPKEVWRRTREVIGGALANSDLEAGDIAAVGITNQRETTVVWDRETGEPVYNAIVWQDTRTDAIVRRLAGDEGPDRLAGGGRGARPAARADRPAAVDLLRRAEGHVDPRQRRRRAREGRAGPAAVR